MAYPPDPVETRGTQVDPVCVFHGKLRSEHECLVCCLCFKTLTKEECAYEPNGTQIDICVPCKETELALLVERAQSCGCQR